MQKVEGSSPFSRSLKRSAFAGLLWFRRSLPGRLVYARPPRRRVAPAIEWRASRRFKSNDCRLGTPVSMPEAGPPEEEPRIEQLRAEGDQRDRELSRLHDHEAEQDALIARLRTEAGARDADLAALREQLASSQRELEDLRAIRDALAPPELPERPGIDLAAGFIPATDRVSGDFYLVAEGPATARSWSSATSSATACAPRRLYPDHVRRHRAVLGQPVPAAGLDQRRAPRAQPRQHRLRHDRLHHLPAARPHPPVGLCRPSTRAVARRAARGLGAEARHAARHRRGPRLPRGLVPVRVLHRRAHLHRRPD
jgi:hypothetical protein